MYIYIEKTIISFQTNSSLKINISWFLIKVPRHNVLCRKNKKWQRYYNESLLNSFIFFLPT